MQTQDQINATAARLKELGVPDELNRWLALTPETLKANQAARTRIMNNTYRREPVRRLKTEGRSTITAGHAANLDDAGRALLKEITQKQRADKIARLRHLKEKAMSKKVTGPKETALREQRSVSLTEVAATVEGKANAESWNKIPAVAKAGKKAKKPHEADARLVAGWKQVDEAKKFDVCLLHDGAQMHREAPTLEDARQVARALLEETKSNRRPIIYAVDADGKLWQVGIGVEFKAPQKPAAKAATPAKAAKKVTPKPTKKAPAAKANGESKTDIAIRMLKKGATRKAIAEATNWPSINLAPIAKRHGLKLSQKDGVYHAA